MNINTDPNSNSLRFHRSLRPAIRRLCEEGDGAALVLAPDGWDVEILDTVRYRRNALVQATSLDVLRDLCGGKDPAEHVDYIAEWVEDFVEEWVDGEIDLETAELCREESYRACEEQRDQRDELTSPRLEMLMEIFEKL